MIVGIGRRPVPVEEWEIGAVRRVLEAGWPMEPWKFLQSGDRVVIDRGALRGVTGILLSTRGECRLDLVREPAAAIGGGRDRPRLGPSRGGPAGRKVAGPAHSPELRTIPGIRVHEGNFAPPRSTARGSGYPEVT